MKVQWSVSSCRSNPLHWGKKATEGKMVDTSCLFFCGNRRRHSEAANMSFTEQVTLASRDRILPLPGSAIRWSHSHWPMWKVLIHHPDLKSLNHVWYQWGSPEESTSSFRDLRLICKPLTLVDHLGHASRSESRFLVRLAGKVNQPEATWVPARLY